MKISKILIGIDDSKFAEYAASYGFDIARTFNAHVGLVHIVEPGIVTNTSSDSITGMPIQAPVYDEINLLDIQKDQAENVIERTIKKYAQGLQVTHFNEYGSTADGILNCSQEFNADLIVLGTHSRSGLDRLLMGSVAESVVRNSQVPVLVVPLVEIGE
ncbi:universal stress protein [Mucilaginibacter phyllosphaerae]|uniref:Nucleotide-binding universal stress UspA family protein n=1 Tax=Mucilaginibacter phyllosphaerae TaxID=1812349 RepID=A0A4Y8A9V1_9SPHI|nr:universal stress protein [Mucilaginibacter phyllosphaerae]MBB3969833.1 nucleotide-binding universal stress UspA family protein [Mucilaginibacter phyllosphaerae]TEW65208.1 universal stress protein [Mucilaginibacter phyllosphaerae]GGH17269.1 universal stress protein [Mucilaginibacter phyllosphaerae]